MYKRNATLIFIICFLGGVFMSAFFELNFKNLFPIYYVSQFYFLGFLFLGLILTQVLGGEKNKRKTIFFILLVVVFVVSFFGGAAAHQNYNNKNLSENSVSSHIHYYNNGGKIIFRGMVSDYPDKRIDQTKYTIESFELVEAGLQQKEVSGSILLTANHYPEYQYGDILEISGALKTPAEFPDFNYKDYLSKDGIYSVIYYPKINKIGKVENINTVFRKAIFAFREETRESLYRIFPAPHSSILSAMVLGDKSLLSEELKNKLSVTGMRHIVAISGMHIFILIRILEMAGLRIGLWRKHIFYFVLFLITIYILMIGAPASAIRAGIMGVFLLLANKIGRINDPKRIIIFAAVGILALNPSLLRLDIGFQLSFLAVLGIMYFEKYFEKLTRFLPETLFFGYFPIRSVAAMSLAAQITTLPVVVYNFGIISFLSPVINVLVVPLLSFIMPFAIVAGVGGIFFAKIFIFLSWPLYAVLYYIVFMVDLFSKIPIGFIKIESDINFLWLLPWYVGLFLFYKKYLNRSVEIL